MPNLFLLFLQTFISPLILIGFFIAVLFGIAQIDGVPIARAFLVLFINIVVGIVTWFFRATLTILALFFPFLLPLLEPGGSKTKGKSK
jgi:hypothetical protein